MSNWGRWKDDNRNKIEHIAGFEELFVDSILSKIPSITPDDVFSQYHFVDFQGKNRYIDFMIINTSKGYSLPIELDGYSKLELERDYSRFNDFLERQNALITKFGILLRYTNKKMLNDKASIIKEISDVLNKQSEKLSTEQINNKHIHATIQDYKEMVETLQSQSHSSHITNTDIPIHHVISEIQQQLYELSQQFQSPKSRFPKKEIFTFKRIIIFGSVVLLFLLLGSLLIKGFLSSSNVNVETNVSNSIDSVSDNDKFKGFSANEANQLIGTTQTICGRVVEVKDFSKGKYFNFNQIFPKQPFTVVIWSNDLPNVGKIEYNKELCVTGEITDYKGKPQMQIQSSQQISIN